MEPKKLVLSVLTTFSETRIAVYSRKNQFFSETVIHDSEVLKQLELPIKQLEIRSVDISSSLAKNNINLSDLGAVVTKGGMLKEIDSGLYYINQKMADDASKNLNCLDFGNLGILLAKKLSQDLGITSYMADPDSANEITIIAKNPPLNVLNQNSKFSVLTHKGVGRKASLLIGKNYSMINLIVANLDTEISISAHQKGRIIDTAQTFVPSIGSANGILIDDKLLTKDPNIELTFESLAYHISKDIGALASSLKGDVDGIVITGEIVKSEFMMRWISERVNYLGNIFLFPNENEMDFLAESVVRMLDGEENVKEYR